MIEKSAALIVMAAGLAAGFGAGWTANGWRWEARSSAVQTAHEQALNAAQKVVADALERAREIEAGGAALAQKQLALEAANTKLAKEKQDALRKITTGRACLGDTALRLLNDTGAGGGFRLLAPSGGAFGTPAAAFADSGDAADGYAASDTDIALWSLYARGEYDRCRGRIDALRKFFNDEE